ncbi:MAG: hypothetical protein KDA75_11605 [Planctomycetaceae bacterium]|nr:hypothetical protein [Planctomycetaceae bacterium]
MLVIGVLYASHPLTLPLMADLLVVDVATDEGQLAFPLDGAAAVKWVAEAVRAGRVQMVGLSRRRPSRLVERRLLPDPWDQTNQDLDRQGVSADRRWTIPRILEDDQDFSDEIEGYLKKHPDAVILLVCSKYRSGRIERSMGRLIERDLANRVHVVPVDSDGVRPSDWWKSSDGQRVVVTEAIRAAAGWLCDSEPRHSMRRTDAEFRQAAIGR